ncbi:MAG: DNA-directed RNA polymerase subunit beta [Planctomycetia bacterium]|nr:DNA-directed RNA polymerase subunit beta [Planctomycetia bacterium]
MATSQTRRIYPDKVRRFGSSIDVVEAPDLTKIQTASYERFLQYQYPEDQREGLPDEVRLNDYKIPPEKRQDMGLESVLREIFPITGHDDKVSLEYVSYELGKPKYGPDECRRLKLTYGRPLTLRLRLNKDEPIEQDVYLGELPIMIGGGEFIINGAERVVVSQLHRSPGVDFISDEEGANDASRSFSCRIIPERGSWIELNISKKASKGESITVRIDQTGKFSAITLLRAMDPKFSENANILRAFFETRVVKTKTGRDVANIEGKIAVDNVIYPSQSEHAGEIIVECGQKITKNLAEQICTSEVEEVEVMEDAKNALLMNTLAEDVTLSYEEALLRIYQRMRPGNPPQLDKAKKLFEEKFTDVNRYRLGRVGRFRINRKFGLNVPEEVMNLQPEDLISAIKAMLGLYYGDPGIQIDDIDHLGNRRLRTIDELAAEEIRKGFAKLRRTVLERMGVKDVSEMEPRSLINPKSVSSTVDFFFGRGELSQVVDQTNPLSMLTHERRLSALGPGGLNRKRAGFDVRDVHSSHYGRICPIETPEGTNIGLISSLAIYAGVDEYGFLVTPYQVVENGKLTGKIHWLRADEEGDAIFAPADVLIKDGVIVGDSRAVGENVIARRAGEYEVVNAKKVNYIDVSPSQMIGVSAGLVPFLEHDDANRALMGSNMQRQAVPLLVSETPLVGTGLERVAALNSSLLTRARRGGKVTYCDARRIIINGEDEYVLRKFIGLNERTCQNQKPIVVPGQEVKAGDVIADGAATHQGNLALGRNVLAAFMVWEGYNFEDAIILSEELVQNDVYTSIHIEEYDIEIRETKLGKEEFTRDIPNVSEKMLRNLDENGIVRIGTHVEPGDILVGKVTPKSKTELTPEEKLLHTIFGRAGEDVKNDSLEVPSGVEGIVIDTQYYSRRTSLSELERSEFEARLKEVETEYSQKVAEVFAAMIERMEDKLKEPILDKEGAPIVEGKSHKAIVEEARKFDYLSYLKLPGAKRRAVLDIMLECRPRVERQLDTLDQKLDTMKIGDQLRSGVLRMAKVYIATKRVISVGDKMAGRHGNKGVISKIMKREDMPFLPDGTPIQILLNPLGVPSRMNVGQILETHLGWAGATSHFRSVTPVFNGAKEEDINDALEEAGLPRHGKARLYDGRTGEPFEQETTVGYIYMLKLHHLVDDKVHARSTGPYSMITQQPLGGKARFGGQRFGEMEVWALEAYGAAYILQELLTVKSDDVEGRTKIYEAMVKGENRLVAGTPASFDVLTNEIRGLGLNMQLERGNNVLAALD